jgi:hypothetical protein
MNNDLQIVELVVWNWVSEKVVVESLGALELFVQAKSAGREDDEMN